MSHQVLAIKYRPQKFSEVKGQQHILEALQNAIANNVLPPSILFSGTRGTGKTTLARLVAKTLNCENPIENDACNTCESCKAVQAGSHLDVMELDGASYTGVDHIREIIDASQYKAVMGKYRIFIIDEAHMLSKNAFNALLKNLEEPSQHVVYMLATTEPHKIPDTILSRCMSCQTSLFTAGQIIKTLEELLKKENLKYEPSCLYEIAAHADGSLRDALTLLNQAIILSFGEKLNTTIVQNMLGTSSKADMFNLLESLFSGNVNETLVQLRSVVSSGVSGNIVIEQIMDLIYWSCCIKSTPELKLSQSYTELDKTRGAQLANQINFSKLHMIWQVFQKGHQEYLASPLKTPTLEMIFMRACFVRDLNLSVTSNLNATSNPVKNEITHLDQLLKIIKQKKEAVLFEQLNEQYICEVFPNKNLVISSPVDKKTATAISTKLKKLTGDNWQVSIKSEDSTPDLSPSHSQSQKQVNTKESVISDLANTFPDMVVTTIDKETE